MENKLQKIYFQLCSISVFVSVTTHPLFTAFEEYCQAPPSDICAKMKAYAKFVSEIYKGGTSLTELVTRLVFEDKNVYAQGRKQGKELDVHIVKSARRELEIFSLFAAILSDDFAEDLGVIKMDIPQFGSFNKPLGGAYEEYLNQAAKNETDPPGI